MSIEQERAEFEAWATSQWLVLQRTVHGEDYQDLRTQVAWEAYQAGRAALQSQDREKRLVAAIREAIELLGPEAPSCSGCEYEWNHALRVLREAIDHARRAEGGGG